MPRLLFLVRHGLTDWNEQGRLLGRCEIPLNERGREQAAALAEALRRFAPDHLLVSPQRRTRETAAAIASACGLAAHVDADLDEVWLGRWQGKSFVDLHADDDARAYLRDVEHECDAVESLTSLAARTAAVAARLRQSEARAQVLVSHGDPLRVLLTALLGMAPAELRAFSVSPGSVSVVRLGRKRTQLAALNWRPADLYDLMQS
jgi:probable phosphoglycerate mutase